ncbi:MAG: Rid family hydrolase [Congregibacter sp.]
MPALKNKLLDRLPGDEDLELCLGLFSFLGESAATPVEPVYTQLARLEGPENAIEVLQLDRPVTGRGNRDGVYWVSAENLQLSWVYVPEVAVDEVEDLSRDSYLKLLEQVHSSGFPELVRFWNFLPHINQGNGDRELYKRFCTGRLDAFNTCNVSEAKYPAASALGHYQAGMTIAVLSSHRAARHFHNPRQVDAYKYPRQYGPSSPSFARASLLQLGSSSLYFVSGTASIVGHNSVHIDELEPQLETTADNIRCLLDEAGFAISDINLLRVYLRNVQDKAECARVLDGLFPRVETLYLHADVCRAELLVEIECICSKN